MHLFTGNPLDRVSAMRLDSEWLRARLDEPQSRYLAMWRLQALVKADGPALAWAKRGLLERVGSTVEPILLGLADGVAHYAVDVSSLDEPLASLGLAGAADFEDVRTAAARLAAGESAILAQARALVDWHATHPFCARCGAATAVEQGGNLRRCSRCSAEHFPRVNPVVIMLVVRGERCLLGRQAAWPKGMYSTLAGFVETGESIEEAVRREVLEEAGVQVGEVTYHSSQPWPFPSSLMIGCMAEATSEAIVPDLQEVEDVAWFDREIVARACREGGMTEGLTLPPPMAIGRRLCDLWVGA